MTQYLGLLVLAVGYLVYRRLSWKTATFERTTVRDGDSIRIDGNTRTVECRITGYDSPEWNQQFGPQATRRLKDLLADGFRFKIVGIDDYNRALLVVRNAKGSVARQMVSSGHGHNSGKWGVHQFIAQACRRGLWADRNAVTPAIFRLLNPRKS
jgi:endonuclease YncB( thermonuclease family)